MRTSLPEPSGGLEPVGCAITRLRAGQRGVECQTGEGSNELNGFKATDRPHPRNVDDTAQLGTLGEPLHRPRSSRACACVAGARQGAGGVAPRPGAASGNGHHRDRRSLRQDHSRPRPGADHHRPFVRRPPHPAPARPWAGRRRCGARYRRTQGCAQAAVLDAQVRMAGARESCERRKGNAADQGAIPLVLHERAQQGRVRQGLRPLLHPGERTAVLPGGPRQLQPERQDEGRLQEPRTSAASAHHRSHRSDLSPSDQPVDLQAAAEGALCHRPQGVPGPLSLAGPGRLGGSRGLRAQLDDRARTRRRCRACRGAQRAATSPS